MQTHSQRHGLLELRCICLLGPVTSYSPLSQSTKTSTELEDIMHLFIFFWIKLTHEAENLAPEDTHCLEYASSTNSLFFRKIGDRNVLQTQAWKGRWGIVLLLCSASQRMLLHLTWDTSLAWSLQHILMRSANDYQICLPEQQKASLAITWNGENIFSLQWNKIQLSYLQQKCIV